MVSEMHLMKLCEEVEHWQQEDLLYLMHFHITIRFLFVFLNGLMGLRALVWLGLTGSHNVVK